MSASSASPVDIAIIGMSALFAKAANLSAYWQNILNKVNAVTEAPDSWALPYFDPNSQENDRIYTRKGGFLRELAEFNPLEFGIMPNAVDGGEPDQYLALKLARDALRDAGYEQRPFNREKTGIILGRGTYVNRGYTTLIQHGMIVDQTLALLRQIRPDLDEAAIASVRQGFKQSLPPFSTEMLPGLVPNNVTGRIANRLNLMGPNFIIDAACASSLIAVHLGINELISGRCDMVLAGGVHASTPPQIYMIFCQLGGLSRSDIRPFDEAANGTLLGEGLGILVLKRLRDAERDGDRIYAVIKGIGISSDGKALGLLAPRLEGEVLALQRAYTNSGIDPATIGLVEAHGTSIPLGDRTEIQALSRLFGERNGSLPHCALGSVKSAIGHCIPAAGSAGLIKTALALYHKIYPPTLCDRVNPDLGIEQTPFYINNEPRPWIHGHPDLPRRAGVNAFGFGGINAHAVLEEYRSKNAQPYQSLQHQRSTELFVFSSNDSLGLLTLLEQVQRFLQAQPEVSLANLAYTLSLRPVGACRLAIVAPTVQTLETKLKQAREKLTHTPLDRWHTRDGICYGSGKSPGKIVFLFPGEGAQYANMLADLCLYFPQVRAWFDFLDRTFWGTRNYLPSSVIFPPPTSLTADEKALAERLLFGMDLGSEAVFVASMALNELLAECGVFADAMLGHSTGENAALFASGIVRLQGQYQLSELMRHLNRIYCDLETSNRIPRGALLTVGAIAPEVVAEKVAASTGKLHLAIDNCRNQVVLFGQQEDIETIRGEFSQMGGICLPLPFDRAYHTPLFAEVGAAFRAFYDLLDVSPGDIPLYSCATTDVFPSDATAIRELATRQWSSRVRFRETTEILYNRGYRIFVEVGPSSNLTGFVQDSLRGQDLVAIASNSRRKAGLEQFEILLGRLFANGVGVNFAPLYRDRTLTILSFEDSADAIPPKKGIILNLNMPIMQLSSAIDPEIQQRLISPPVAADDASIPVEMEREEIVSFSSLTYETALPQLIESEVVSKTPDQPLTLLENADREDREMEIWADEEYSDINSTINHHQDFDSTTLISEPIEGIDYQIDNLQYPVVSPLSDAIAVLVSDHFDLMQTFLFHQQEVLTHFYQNLYQNGSLSVEPTTWNHDELQLSNPQIRQELLSFEQAYPFLGEAIERSPNYLVCDRHFNLERDRFLCDHTLGGKPSQYQSDLLALPVMPFTFSMEIVAEAAHCLMGGTYQIVSMYNLRGYRWLTLDRGDLVLRIQAQRQATPDSEGLHSVFVRLFQLGTGTAEGMLVFEGEVRLADRFSPPPAPLPFELNQPLPAKLADADLYKTGMFHGSRLQGVKHLISFSQSGIEADLQILPVTEFFSHTDNPILQTDAGLLDAAGQLVGYWLTEQFGAAFNCFPFQVKAFHQFTSPLPPGSSIRCRASIRFTSEQQIEAYFDLLDGNNQPIARLEQWQDRYFSVPNHFSECRLDPQTAYLSQAWMQAETGLYLRRIVPFPQNFLEDAWAIWQRVLVHLMLNATEREYWYGLPSGAKRSNWLLGRIAAKDAVRQWVYQSWGINLAPIDIEIKTTELGKPYAECFLLSDRTLPSVSISHSGTEAIAAATSIIGEQIGIDFESYEVKHSPDLLLSAFTPQEQARSQQSPPGEQEALLLSFWCAKEAAAKAFGTGLQGDPQQWQIVSYSPLEQKIAIAYRGIGFGIKFWLTDIGILAISQLAGGRESRSLSTSA